MLLNKKILTLLIVSALNVTSLMADKYKVTINCHVSNGFTVEHVSFYVNGDEYGRGIKKWIWNHKNRMNELCDRTYSGYWFDGIYDISKQSLY